MSGKPFFDTNVLLYLLTQDDPKALRVRILLEEGGFISVQVLNELVSVSRRKARLDWLAVRSLLRVVQTSCESPGPITEQTHRSALTLSERYSYTIYDSLLLASALEQGCDTFYSEDLHDGQSIEGLTIRNPFRKPQ